jgi:hypothetical protein
LVDWCPDRVRSNGIESDSAELRRDPGSVADLCGSRNEDSSGDAANPRKKAFESRLRAVKRL